MPTIRTFIAIDIDDHAKQRLSEFISYLKKTGSDVKWIDESQMHLTLKFLGNIDDSKIQQISRILKSVTENFKSFSITLSGIGAFPNLKHPRVIWIGVEKGKDQLKDLNTIIEDYMEEEGFPKENRPYKAHLTIGRVKTSRNLSVLSRLIAETNFQLDSEIKIDEIILFKSTLTPKGAIYTPLYYSKFS